MRERTKERTLKRRVHLMLSTLTAVMLLAGPMSGAVSGASGDNGEIVDPYRMYTYDMTAQAIGELAKTYPDLIRVETIGTTVFGREIQAVRLGTGEATVLMDGSQHAREWMGTNLLLYMIDRYAYMYEHNMKYNEYVIRDVLDNCSIWFVPMVNPDGVTLQQLGPYVFPDSHQGQLFSMNGGSSNFKRWKSNAQGIDINRQYPALWSGIRNSPAYPMYKNYKGSAPAETAEAESMMRFTYGIDPEVALSYHTSGEVLYWHFNTDPGNLARDKRMADAISAMTGYSQVRPETHPSGGGFTDWFIAEFGRPGFTAELGPYQEEAELPLWTFTGIWEENAEMGLYLASEGYELWQDRYPVVPADESLQLLEQTPLYNRPDGAFPTGAQLNGGGKLRADARLGDWYRVDTWLGPKWIRPRPTGFLKGQTESYAETIPLKETTTLYHYPDPREGRPLGQLTPQHVKAVERWQNWALVRTWLGDAWVQIQP